MEIFQDDIFRFLMGLVALIPLCYVLRFLPFTVRYWYSTIVALAIEIWVYHPSIYPIFVQHIIVFLIIKIKGPKCGKLVTFESIIYLGGYHLYEVIFNYGGWSMNGIGLMMVLVPKYSLIAYNIEDGVADVAKLSDEQKRFRIVEEVGFLDYLGYLSFLPTCLVGPPIEYRDYKFFMDGTQVYGNIPTKDLNKRMLITFAQTIVLGIIYFLYETYVPISKMRTLQFYENSFLFVLFYAPIAVTLARSKYYTAWKLCMVSVHASGISYNGIDFSRINTCNPLLVETTIHVREKINFWNIGIQEWLRKCIYNRCNIKSKALSQLYVFVVSAMWHGFYIAYYFSFFIWFAQLYLQGIIFKYCKNGKAPLVKIYKKMGILGYALLWLLVHMSFSHCGAFFLILEGYYCIQLFLKLYGLPQILLFVAIAIFSNIRPPRDDPKPKTDQETPLVGQNKKQVKQE